MSTQDLHLNPYGKLCTEIYELDKPPGSLFDPPYYLERLAGLDGPILEPAVGTGRLLIPLLEAGHEADGFDPSDPMLERCRAHCRARGLNARLWSARFQDFTCDRVYAAVIVPVSTFTFVDSFAEALAVLRRFHDVLRPGGLLLIDIPPPAGFWTGSAGSPDAIRTWTAENGDLLRFEAQHVDTDPLNQRSVAHMRYERWRDGRLVESELEVMAGRAWGMEEFRLTLEAAGFSDVGVTGGYRIGGTVRRGDRILNFEARRPA